jgi:hypothetical protein
MARVPEFQFCVRLGLGVKGSDLFSPLGRLELVKPIA